MRVWVVGAGAIGGTVAARLVRAAAAEVTVFDTDRAHAARLRDPGLELVEPEGTVTTPLDVRDEVPEPGPDALLLAVRSASTEQALEPFVDHLGEHADVVSLQNGLNEERIAALVGAGRTIGCVVGFAATYLEPGRVELTASGELVVGRLDGGTDPRLEAVRDVLVQAFPCRTTADITSALWGKLLVNAMTVLGAAGGVLLGELLADEPGRRVAVSVIAEGVDVARADGVRLGRVLGMVEPDLVAERADGWLESMHHALEVVRHHFGDVRSVTWRDLELGRPIEIDAVTGEIVRRGQAHGVATPVNAAVYGMLREIEAGDRPIHPANLVELGAVAG